MGDLGELRAKVQIGADNDVDPRFGCSLGVHEAYPAAPLGGCQVLSETSSAEWVPLM